MLGAIESPYAVQRARDNGCARDMMEVGAPSIAAYRCSHWDSAAATKDAAAAAAAAVAAAVAQAVAAADGDIMDAFCIGS